MGLALLMTLTGIVCLFIVFRVVTPETRRPDIRPQRVLVLNPLIPAERALIHQAMDRSFGLLPTEPLVADPAAALKLPTFEPSYARHELRLKPLPTGLTTSTQSRPFALDIDILPPLSGTPKTTTQPVVSSVLRAVVGGGLAARATQSVEVKEVLLADVTRPRFQVGVGPLGQVIVALPLAVSEDPEMVQKLHHAITQMRFAPSSNEIEWGQISFRWEREGAR